MRCLTLAEELSRKGHECIFICREHEGHLGDLITQAGFRLYLLAKPVPQEKLVERNLKPIHAEWLGCPWQKDAEETQNILNKEQPDWLVVDHYALDAQWEREVASAVGQIMVIDDLADREHECSVLLDQNVLESHANRQYQTKVNEGCRLLLGPKYALLRPEYAALAEALPERDGIIARVLIFVGGSDPYHLTERYLEALIAAEFSHLFVDVVVGKNHPSFGTVEQLVLNRSKTRLYSGLPSLAALMVRADLMLGAGGTTNWERMCLGLNAVVASIARNQTEINHALGTENLITFLGNADTLANDAVAGAIQSFLVDPESNRRCSNAIREIVNGCGAKYVSHALIGN
jgi:UDP-2,4-diacetamido-2,4,6-trideoxy-beta-L-altropyranose hydrolase